MNKVLNFKKETGQSAGYRIVNKSATTAEITIYGEIGDSWWGDSVSAKSFSEDLSNLDSTVNQIDLRLNSPGGDVFDGMVIYNRLKQHKASVTVYIDGLAASIASVIMMAGDKIIMGEGALVMVHKPWTIAAGDSNDLESTIDRLNDIEDQLIGIYQRNTKLDRAELRKMVNDETWMDANQALENNFVTEIMEEEDEVSIAASMDKASWIKHKPKNIKTADTYVEDKINEILKR